MISPQAVLERLHQHLQTTLGRDIHPTELAPNAMKPGSAEFSFTRQERRDGVQDGGATRRRAVLGYVALHFDEDASAASTLDDGAKIDCALETFLDLDEIAGDDAVVEFTYDDAELFLNAAPNLASAPLVQTLAAYWTLVVDLEN